MRFPKGKATNAPLNNTELSWSYISSELLSELPDATAVINETDVTLSSFQLKKRKTLKIDFSTKQVSDVDFSEDVMYRNYLSEFKKLSIDNKSLELYIGGVLRYYYTKFDGVNEYINFPSSTADFSFIQNTGVFGISCWIKLEDYASGTVERIASTFDGTTANKGMVLMYEDRFPIGVGAIRFYSSRGAGAGATVQQFKTNNGVITDNDWHHIVCTSNNVTGKIWIDGVDITLAINTVSTLSTGDSTSDMTFANDATLTAPAEISLDDIAFFDESLSSIEVPAIYALGRKNPDLTGFSGLVNHWRMDNVNPIDIIGSVNGTGVNIDNTNIIEWD
jgi:hypothetical protein